MTIENQDLAQVYEQAREGNLGQDAYLAAEAADAGFDRMNGWLPGSFNDDRAENMVHKMFAYALETQGTNWRGLVGGAYAQMPA